MPKLFHRTASLLAFKIAASGCGFIASIVTARLLGAEDFGVFSYVLIWGGLIGIVVNYGFPVLAVREIARYRAESNWKDLRSFIHWISLSTLAFSLVMAVVNLLSIPFLDGALSPPMLTGFWFLSILIPLLSRIDLYFQYLRGLGHVMLSQVPRELGQPLAFLIFLPIALFMFNGKDRLLSVFLVQSASLFSIAFIGWFLLNRLVPVHVRHQAPRHPSRLWFTAGTTFFFLEIIQMLNHRADIIILGILCDSAQTGIYSVVQKLSNLATFPLMAGNYVIATKVAEAFSTGQREEFKALATQGATIVFSLSLPIIIVVFSLKKVLLSLWGPDFIMGATALSFLLAGQLYNVFFANIVLLLNMTGKEDVALRGATLGVMINLLLDILLIPEYGMNGAAAATMSSFFAWNTFLAFQVVRHHGIDPSPFHLLSGIKRYLGKII